MQRRKLFVLILLLGIIGCVCAKECLAYLSYPNESFGGFWQGLWHGIISFITLPLSVWFPASIHVYNSINNGFAYNIGFFVPAILECEVSIPLLLFAWVIRIIFWVVVFAIGLILSMLGRG